MNNYMEMFFYILWCILKVVLAAISIFASFAVSYEAGLLCIIAWLVLEKK